LKVYALRRAGGGLLATQVALVHAGRVVRPLLAVDTGSLYTIVEPTFITALGLDLAQPLEQIDITALVVTCVCPVLWSSASIALVSHSLAYGC
jgi:hypothetical protein